MLAESVFVKILWVIVVLLLVAAYAAVQKELK